MTKKRFPTKPAEVEGLVDAALEAVGKKLHPGNRALLVKEVGALLAAPASAPPAPPAVQQLNAKYGVACTISSDRIDVVRNPRKHFDDAKLAELAQNLAEVGILQPLIVRAALFDDLTDPTTRFQLVAGERRLRAARLAGLTEVPVSVRWLTDRQAMEVQATENLQRENLNPAEEAVEIAELLSASSPLAPAFTVEELAARIGRSPQFVAQRAAIGRALGEPLLTWLRDGRLTIAAATVLARLPHLDAAAAAAALELSLYYQKDKTVGASQAENYVQQLVHALDRAAFPLDAPDLNPARPGLACGQCPERAKAQHHLFPEAVEAETDHCLNRACYATKAATHLANVAAQVEAQTGTAPLRVSTHWCTSLPNVLPANAYRQVSADTPGAVPALLVEGASGQAEQTFVVLKETRSADRYAAEAAEQTRKKKIERRLHQLLAPAVIEDTHRMPAAAADRWLDNQLQHRLMYADVSKWATLLIVDFGWDTSLLETDTPPPFATDHQSRFHTPNARMLWRNILAMETHAKLHLLARIEVAKLDSWSNDQYTVSDDVLVAAARAGIDVDELRAQAAAAATPKGRATTQTASVAEEGGAAA